MRSNHNRSSSNICLPEDGKDLVFITIIQITCRFVGKEQFGIIHQGPCKGNSLLFTA